MINGRCTHEYMNIYESINHLIFHNNDDYDDDNFDDGVDNKNNNNKQL